MDYAFDISDPNDSLLRSQDTHQQFDLIQETLAIQDNTRGEPPPIPNNRPSSDAMRPKGRDAYSIVEPTTYKIEGHDVSNGSFFNFVLERGTEEIEFVKSEIKCVRCKHLKIKVSPSYMAALC
jgi:hypothetical protein